MDFSCLSLVSGSFVWFGPIRLPARLPVLSMAGASLEAADFTGPGMGTQQPFMEDVCRDFLRGHCSRTLCKCGCAAC
jgi:hypothetical protein